MASQAVGKGSAIHIWLHPYSQREYNNTAVASKITSQAITVQVVQPTRLFTLLYSTSLRGK